MEPNTSTIDDTIESCKIFLNSHRRSQTYFLVLMIGTLGVFALSQAYIMLTIRNIRYLVDDKYAEILEQDSILVSRNIFSDAAHNRYDSVSMAVYFRSRKIFDTTVNRIKGEESSFSDNSKFIAYGINVNYVWCFYFNVSISSERSITVSALRFWA
jgi:hypothetical protein